MANLALNSDLHTRCENQIENEIQQNLIDRNNRSGMKVKHTEFTKFIKMDDIYILVTGAAEFERKFPTCKAYVEVCRPGYSKDAKAAVLNFSFGPTDHGAIATYMLTIHENSWIVKYKYVRYFL